MVVLVSDSSIMFVVAARDAFVVAAVSSFVSAASDVVSAVCVIFPSTSVGTGMIIQPVRAHISNANQKSCRVLDSLPSPVIPLLPSLRCNCRAPDG